MAKVVSIINYKGGVGKTTTTFHIGCALAQEHSKKVLLVDIDPQTNLTFLCVPIEKWEDFKKKNGTIASLYEACLKRQALDVKRVLWRSPVRYGRSSIAGLDLIPCDVELLGEDLGGARVAGIFRGWDELRAEAAQYLRELTFLKRVLGEVERGYDYILIDCPPNLYLMTQNALVASNWYVITTIPDHLSTIGLSILIKKVSEIGNRVSQAAALAGESISVATLGGVIFVRVRIGGTLLTNVHTERMAMVKSVVGAGMCFDGCTTELIGYSEAAQNQLPVWLYSSPNARRAAKKNEYGTITDEFLRRL